MQYNNNAMGNFDNIAATVTATTTVDGLPYPAANKESDISCLSCRHKKVKCDREKPSCNRCAKAGRKCQYPDGPMKPGPKAGTGYRSSKRPRTEGEQANGQYEPERRSGEQTRLSTPDARLSWGNPPSKPSSVDGKQFEAGLVDRSRQSVSESKGTSPSEDAALTQAFIDINPFKFGATNKRSGSTGDGLVASPPQSRNLLYETCEALRTSFEDVQDMIERYFHNMAAYSLFYKPGFEDKLRSIQEPSYVRALLAAMFIFASHFRNDSPQRPPSSSPASLSGSLPSIDEYYDMAVKYIDEAMRASGDQCPSIEVLQAMILVALHQCVRGWRGLAWRTIGAMARLAFELELHQVDVNKDAVYVTQEDPDTWCEEEEQRRTFWGVWELDVFVSTLRRLPSAIDISQVETFLPGDDEHWFSRTPQQSCFLATDPSQRWRALKLNNVQSPRAWFIVANSYMRSAMLLADPKGGSRGTVLGFADNAEASSEDYSIIEDAIYCFDIELPSILRYRGERFNFSSDIADVFLKKHQCEVYGIHTMTQLIRFMLHRRKVFQKPSGSEKGIDVMKGADKGPSSSRQSPSETADEQGPVTQWTQYMHAMDEVLTMIRRSSPDHIKFVNPLTAHIVWLATALLLVYQRLGFVDGSKSKRLLQSNVDVLKATYMRFSEHWNMSPILTEKLRSLEEGLTRFKEEEEQQQQQQQQSANNAAFTSNSGRKQSVVNQQTLVNGFSGFSVGDGPGTADQSPNLSNNFATIPHSDPNTGMLASGIGYWPQDPTFIPPPESAAYTGFLNTTDFPFNNVHNAELQGFLDDIFATNTTF